MTHILLTSAGTRSQTTTYRWPEGLTMDAEATGPVALRHLASKGMAPERVIVLSSPDALASNQWWLERDDVEVTRVPLDLANMHEPWNTLMKVLEVSGVASGASFDGSCDRWGAWDLGIRGMAAAG